MPSTPRSRTSYGDVGRVILPHRQRVDVKTAAREEIQAAHAAIAAEEPRRRYARVQDADGHHWVRGNTRWTCQSPVNGRDVTQVGRLGWSMLVGEYGPLTVLDEHLPETSSPQQIREEHAQAAAEANARIAALAPKTRREIAEREIAVAEEMVAFRQESVEAAQAELAKAEAKLAQARQQLADLDQEPTR